MERLVLSVRSGQRVRHFVPSGVWRGRGDAVACTSGRLAAGVWICGLLSFFVSLGWDRLDSASLGMTSWAGGERQGPAISSRVPLGGLSPVHSALVWRALSCALSTAPDGATPS